MTDEERAKAWVIRRGEVATLVAEFATIRASARSAALREAVEVCRREARHGTDGERYARHHCADRILALLDSDAKAEGKE